MRQFTLQFIAGSAAALCTSIVASGSAFAQGGGNGQGGSGGGNAHSAATAGMTHWGDPVQSPMNMTARNGMKSIRSPSGGMRSISPDDPGDAAKTGQ